MRRQVLRQQVLEVVLGGEVVCSVSAEQDLLASCSSASESPCSTPSGGDVVRFRFWPPMPTYESEKKS